MESHNTHGRDISSFDLPSTHRLPTVSAADALEDLRTDRSRYVSTGHGSLDHALVESSTGFDGTLPGGLPERPGQRDLGTTRIRENHVWVTIALLDISITITRIILTKSNRLQLASDALEQGQGVVWVGQSNSMSPTLLLCLRRLPCMPIPLFVY
ncbi:hypothetical protein PG989_005096 [Apiospora arundinis]